MTGLPSGAFQFAHDFGAHCVREGLTLRDGLGCGRVLDWLCGTGCSVMPMSGLPVRRSRM